MNILLLLLGGSCVAAGLIVRNRAGTDPRVSYVLLAIGIVVLITSIVLSGIDIGRG